MDVLVGLVILLLYTETVICQSPWKVVHISEKHTEVKVTQCTDPKIYLQFGNAITVGCEKYNGFFIMPLKGNPHFGLRKCCLKEKDMYQ